MQNDTETVGDLVNALVGPIKTATPYTAIVNGKIEHRTWLLTSPSLIDQLAAAVEPANALDVAPRGARSAPAARLDAIDRLRDIEHGVIAWLNAYRARIRPTLRANLKALVGLDVDKDTRLDLEADLYRWALWARVVTGWDAPPWAPNVPCLACDERGGLRVRLDQHTACCVKCGAAWDAYTIGLLAEGIRAANGDTRHDTAIVVDELAAA